MIYTVLLMIIPLFLGLINLLRPSKNKTNFTLQQFLITELVVLGIVSAGLAISRWDSTTDTEIISGQVLAKQRNEVSCSHSYCCSYSNTCDSKGNCHQTCNGTCYDHPYDVDWDVYTNAMDKGFSVDRVDRQGINTPPRWQEIKILDPVAFEHNFDNYIKATPDAILRRHAMKPGIWVPPYPNSTYDYTFVDRFVQIGSKDPHAVAWNSLLMDINGKLGPKKQANVIVVEVASKDPDWEYYVQDAWLNGKKNDIIVLLSVPQYPKIEWARIISWTQSEELKVELRDALQTLGTVESPADVTNLIETQVYSKFERRHFKDFKYLMASYQPGFWTMFLIMLMGIGVVFGSALYWSEGTDDTNYFGQRRRYYGR